MSNPKKNPRTKLNDRQEAFCQAYVNITNFNYEDAYRMAGYTETDPNDFKENAKKLLVNIHVKKRISELVSERNDEAQVDKFFVIEKLRKIVMDNSDEQKNYNAQLKALELLGNHLGIFKSQGAGSGETDDAETMAKTAFERRKLTLLKKDETPKVEPEQSKEVA